MKNKYVLIGLAALFALYFVFAGYRINKINKLFHTDEDKVLTVGESLEYKGFLITLSDLKVKDYQEMIQQYGDDKDSDSNSYEKKILVCHVTGKKISDNATWDPATFSMESIPWKNGLMYFMFTAMNSNEGDISGLKTGESADLYIPFEINNNQLTENDWKNYDTREYSLIVSLYPQKIYFSAHISKS
jgi:hypothetical protein